MLRCEWLADRLTDMGISALYSSYEIKAQETAEILGKKLSLDPIRVEGLQENDRSGFPYIDDETEWKRRFRDFFAQPTQRLIGNESANEAFMRFSSAVTQTIEQSLGENVAIVAHGTVISLFTAHYNDVSAFEIWEGLNPLPAYLSLQVPDFLIEIAPQGFPE